jgi:serine/threonine protein kinase
MNKTDKIGEHTVVRKLGEGAFGEVLLGKHTNGKEVAIKRISKEKVLKVWPFLISQVNKLH